MSKFKEGDVVLCIDNQDGGNYLTVGREYTVLFPEYEGQVSVVNDEDWVSYYPEQDFTLSEKDSSISDKPVVSDGGSSDYYKLTITNKSGESIQCETGDVLRVLVGNDYDLSNIVKACRRMYEASQGRGKAGASIEYDANKIVYFANEFKHWNKENQND